MGWRIVVAHSGSQSSAQPVPPCRTCMRDLMGSRCSPCPTGDSRLGTDLTLMAGREPVPQFLHLQHTESGMEAAQRIHWDKYIQPHNCSAEFTLCSLEESSRGTELGVGSKGKGLGLDGCKAKQSPARSSTVRLSMQAGRHPAQDIPRAGNIWMLQECVGGAVLCARRGPPPPPSPPAMVLGSPQLLGCVEIPSLLLLSCASEP